MAGALEFCFPGKLIWKWVERETRFFCFACELSSLLLRLLWYFRLPHWRLGGVGVYFLIKIYRMGEVAEGEEEEGG